MESEAYCGIPAHQHDDSCYELQLTCEIPESPGHQHTDECYSTSPVLVCKTEEHEHSVDNGCYDEEGNLTCAKAEHTHNSDDECYEEERVLTCEEVETEGHQHGERCYEKALSCGLEVHTHSTECYVNPASDGATTEAAVEVSSGGASTGAAAASTGVSSTGATEDDAVEYDFEDGNEAAGTGDNSNTGATDASENASTALTTVENAAAGVTADGHYVPQLNPVNFPTLLDSHTGIYYHPVADGETVEDSTALTYDQWNRVDKDTELGVNDLLRVYLAYTVPAGSLNPTNQVARYRLPGNLHLTEAQIKAINENVNGIAGQYVNMSTLEILDIEKYYAYLGIEAVEGTRRPDEDVNEYLADLERSGKDAVEYISAIVRVENMYDEQSGEYEGQDLVFTWTPYSIEKNQHEYDSTGQPTKAGEEIQGWLTLDFNLSQVDWDETSVDTFEREVDTTVDAEEAVDAHRDDDEENDENNSDEQVVEDQGVDPHTVETVERCEQTAEIVFAAEGRDENNNKIHEISTTLTVVEETVVDVHTVEDQGENAGEDVTGDQGDAVSEGEAADDATAATTEEAAVDDTAVAATTGETSAEAEEEKTESQYSDGTLTATGDGYRITLDYTADAKIPENAQLNVTEITEASDKEAYEACLEAARQSVSQNAVDGGNQTVDTAASRFFDIEIVAEEIVTEAVTAASDDPTAASEETVADTVADTAVEEAVDNDSAEDAATVGETAVENDAEVDGTNSAEVEESATGEAEESSEPATDGFRKIEPAAPVSVRIELFDTASTTSKTVASKTVDEADSHTVDNENPENTADQQSEPTVLHFSEDGLETIESNLVDAGAVEATVNDNQEGRDQNSQMKEKDGTACGATDGIQAIQFEASSFSIYGVVYTTLSTTVLTASGETYEITVTYDGEAGIPDGAELRVREIPEEEEEYQKAKGLIEAASSEDSVDAMDESSEAMTEGDGYENSESEDSASNDGAVSNGNEATEEGGFTDSVEDNIDGMLAFDISIYDSEGNIVEPESEVSVNIRLITLPEGVDAKILKDTMAVHHIVEEEGVEKAVLVADTGIASKGIVSVDDGQVDVNFVTESFSVYTIKWENGIKQQVRLHFVDENGTDLTTNNNVVFDEAIVNGNTVTIGAGNTGIFGNDGILDLTHFEIDGYTLSNTHKSTWKDLFDNNRSYSFGQNGQQPHTIIGNQLKFENNKVWYQFFYTNNDKAGSGWYEVGKMPTHAEYNWPSSSNPNPTLGRTPTNDGANSQGIFDYFLVYSTNSGTAGGSNNQQDQNIGTVSGSKSKVDNGDGTYNLELSVTAPNTEDEDNNNVNVIIVFDTSSSMKRPPDGGDYVNNYKTNPQSRFYQAEQAVETFVEGLSKNNTLSKPYAVEMALVSFDYSARVSKGWTNSGSEIITALKALNCNTGTNWAHALNVADSIAAPVIAEAPNRKAKTYVLLITDGAPSQYWYGTGNSIGGSSTFFVDGEGSYLAARDEARSVVRNGKELFGIFAFGSTTAQAGNDSDESRNYLGQLTEYAYYDSGKGASNSYLAQDSTTLSNQLTEILGDIYKSFGYSDVEITDGLTSLETTALTSESVKNFTYTIAKYTDIDDGNGNITTEIVPGSKATIVKSGNNLIVTFPDGTIDTIPQASFNSSSKQVTWPLGENKNPRSGYTYTVSFTVWPSQQTYDYIADLMNGIAVWTDNGNGTGTISYPNSSKAPYTTSEIVKVGNAYSLKTNKDTGNGIDYYYTESMPIPSLPQNVTIPAGQTSVSSTDANGVITIYTVNGSSYTKTTKTPRTVIYTNPDPMPLSDNHMKVQKEWVVSRPEELVAFLYNTSNGTIIPDNKNIDFDILQDAAEDPYTSVTLGYDATAGDFAWVGATQPVTVKDENGVDRTYTVGTKWEKQLDISIGLMITPDKADDHSIDVEHDFKIRPVYAEDDEDRETVLYYVLETGHDYTIDEPQLDYRFDFETNVYHPMLVNNVIKDVEIEYKEEGGRIIGILKNITPEGEHLSALTGKNVLRGELKMKKKVLDTAGNEDNSDEANAKVFPLTITLTNDPGDGSTGPFYNIDGNAAEQNVPWYGIQTEDDETTLYYHKVDSEGKFLYYCNEHEACIGGNYINGIDRDNGYRGNMMTASEDFITATATIYVKPKETWTITNIPGGTDYAITETQIDGYEFIKAEEVGASPANKVEKPDPASIDGEIEANKVTNVEFTNKIKPPVFIKKVNASNTNFTADGAEFDLYREFEKQTPTDEEIQNNGLVLKFGKYLQKVNASKIVSGTYQLEDDVNDETDETVHGYVMMGNLSTGDTFYLVETKAPDGYNSPVFDYIKLTFGTTVDPPGSETTKAVINWLAYVENTETHVYETTGTAGRAFVGTIATDHEDGTIDAYTVTVANNPGAELPSTGGPGTRLIYILGGMMTAAAGLLLLHRRKRIMA